MVLGRELGAQTGDVRTDVARLYDYIAYLTEQLQYNDAQLRRLIAKEKGEG